MFERFATATRRAVVDAQAEARELGHHFVSTQHLVLGLLVSDPEQTSAVRAFLVAAGMDVDGVRAAVAEADPRRSSAPIVGTIPFTPRSKKVLELALREALGQGWHEIRPEHLLLGILREGQGSGCRLLGAHGVTLDVVRGWMAGAWTRRLVDWGDRPVTMSRMTVGARHAAEAAQRVAGGAYHTVGTHHLLLGLLDEGEGLAAAVLASSGLTRAAVEVAIAEHGAEGTSDGPPPPRVSAVGQGIEVRIQDPELARRLDQVDSTVVGQVVRDALQAFLSR
jgi:ATP-dependent Clp protease ATP-binding subunit ClpC